MGLNVAIVGASDNPQRYSNMALKMLRDYGHNPLPIHPRLESIEGYACAGSLAELKAKAIPVDTVTMYVNARISSAMLDDLISLKPRRIIFNPGAENTELAQQLKANQIEPIEACTLVMLRTGQF